MISTDVLHDGTYTIRVRSTLDDLALTNMSTEFILTIDDGCESDVVTLVTPIVDTTYLVTLTSTPVTLAALFTQSVPDCPLTYSATQNGVPIDPAILSIDPVTGDLTIDTQDWPTIIEEFHNVAV